MFSKLFYKIFFIILGELCFILPAVSQTETEENLLEGQIEATSSELLEHLEWLRHHRIDLNRTTVKRLQSLPFLSPVKAYQIVEERNKNGLFRSWSDLQKRLNFDKDFLNRLKSYLKISRRKPEKKKSLKFRWRGQKFSPRKSGYKTGAYPGSSWKNYQRINFFFSEHFHGGLLTEKDPGENKWNDHFVGYFTINRLSILKRLIIGNFSGETGQGLVLWGPYGLSKGADPLAPVKKHGKGILGFLYSNENSYFTGAAAEIGRGAFSLTMLVSHSPLDATLNPDGTVKSFFLSGLHRTQSEISKKNSLTETLYGGRVSGSWHFGTVGVTYWQNRYSRRISKNDPERYRFYFSGSQNYVGGIDYDLFLGRFNLFGEIAKSRSGWALIGNAVMDMGKTSIVVSYRYFDPRFQNPHSNSFGTSQINNDQDVYLGLKGKITPSTKISFYYDLFHRPWRTYYTPVPTNGNDFFVQAEQKLFPILTVVFRVRFRIKEIVKGGNTLSGLKKNIFFEQSHHLYRFNLIFHPSPQIRLKTRLEIVNLTTPAVSEEIVFSSREMGFLFYQNVWIRLSHHLTVSTRCIKFNTNSYNSRIYEFEDDLPGVLTIRPLYKKGTSWYILAKWKAFKTFQLSAKLSITYHSSVSEWGSGLEKIQGNIEKRFGLEGDLEF